MSEAGKASARALLAELDAFANRTLSREEFEAYVNAPMSDEERAEIHSLVDWFTRRYPTPAERLAYARRAYTRWKVARGSALGAVSDPPAASGLEARFVSE